MRHLAIALCLPLVTLAAVEPVYVPPPEGPLRQFAMVIDPANPVQPQVLVTATGDTVTAVGLIGQSMYLGSADPFTLQVAGDRLSGSQFVRRDNEKGRFIPLELAVQAQGGSLEGTWKLLLSKAISTNTNRAASAASDESGAVSGRFVTEKELAAANAFSGAGSWDSYMGTRQNFSSVDVGVELVDTLAQARLRWVSPYVGGKQIGDVRHGLRLGTGIVGGAATPLVGDGRVYQFHLVPVGDEVHVGYAAIAKSEKGKEMEAFATASGRTVAEVMRRFAVRADEVMTCLDAATGRVLWQTRWPAAGMNLVGHKTAYSNQTGALGEGKVFVQGSLGVIRALDAATGKQLWTTDIPVYAEAMRQRAAAGATKSSDGLDRAYAHGLNYVGGVVICPTGTHTCPVTALDAKTGAVLWKGGMLGRAATPLRWSSGGVDCVITSNEKNVICLEARTGKELWTIADSGSNEFNVSLEDDYLLTPGGCYRITPQGATKLWAIDPGAIFNSRSVGILYRGNAWIRGGDRAGVDIGGLVVRRASDGVELKREPTRNARAEAITMATEGRIIYNHEAQHNSNHNFEMFAADPATVPPLGVGWRPPYIIDLAYVVQVMYPIVEGRIFMRSIDALYCFDLRKSAAD